MSRGIWGVLPVDKPSGPTSHDVVSEVRKALDLRRVGHTGTLDPFASGLLLVCVGPATRLAEYLTDPDKTYLAEARLGMGTATHDPEGEVMSRSEGWRSLAREDVLRALGDFRGSVLQVPPRYSAKKIGGEAAHRRARRGEAVELEARPVEIHELELTAFDLPRIGFRIVCSRGTYVRAVARDLGEALGVGAHLTALRRTDVGDFSVDEAVAFDALTGGEDLDPFLVSPARALARIGMPSVAVDPSGARRLAQGRPAGTVESGPSAGSGEVAVLLGGELVTVGFWKAGELWPRKVFGEG